MNNDELFEIGFHLKNMQLSKENEQVGVFLNIVLVFDIRLR